LNILETTNNYKVKVTNVYDWLEQSKAEINILRGGRGSSKSHSMAQFFILEKLQKAENKTFVIARKTLPALKKTAYRLVMDLIKEYGFDTPIDYKLNKSDLELTWGSNTLYFLSVDDPEKIKSLNTDDVWLEEATDFNEDDFYQFNLRCSGQIYLSFNPTSALHWIKRKLIDSGNYNIGENVSTYKDNLEFIPERQIRGLEALINVDENLHKIYTLGEWGVLENIIYGKWNTFSKVEFIDGTKFIDGKKVDEITYGLDFGFSNPSCLTEINWIENDFIVNELLYQNKLTNSELIARTKKLIPEDVRYREIYADHSEPDRISEFYHEDFNIHKARKDVTTGIDFCKQHMLGITASSINGIKELQGYSRRKDKDNHVMEEPVKFFDHFCDSMRYGSYSKLDVTGSSRLEDFNFR